MQCYTIKAVPRSNPDGYTFLVLYVTWEFRRDTFSFSVDGDKVEWYRRGSPMFQTWDEGCRYVRNHGWPCNV